MGRNRSILGHMEDEGRHVPRVRLAGAAGGAGHGRSGGARYSRLEEIERKAESVVYAGVDLDLGRPVRIEVLEDPGGEGAPSPESFGRFLTEARLVGGLPHPTVPPVYALGLLEDGRPFVSRKRTSGETLESLLRAWDEADADRHRLLGIFLHVCQGVAFAHARGICHGALTPQVVVVGRFGEVQIENWRGASETGGGDVAALREILRRILAGRSADPALVELCQSTSAAGAHPDAGALAAAVAGHLTTAADRTHRSELLAIEERAEARRANDRAEALRAEAIERRRRHRQLLGVLASAVLLVLVASGAWIWSASARRGRAARARTAVEAALEEAAGFAGRGELDRALSATARAEELSRDPLVPEMLRDRARERHESVARKRDEERATLDLEERRGRLLRAARELRYREGLEPAETLAARRSELEREMAAAGLSPGASPAAAEARQAEAAGQLDRAIDLLREAWWKEPGDADVNFELARCLLRLDPPGTGEAVEHLTVAASLVPESAGLRLRLGDALAVLGDAPGARAAFRSAAAADPEWEECLRRSR